MDVRGGSKKAYLTATLNGDSNTTVQIINGGTDWLNPESNSYTGTYADWSDIINNHDAYEVELVGNCAEFPLLKVLWSDQYNAWIPDDPNSGFSISPGEGFVDLSIGSGGCPVNTVNVYKK